SERKRKEAEEESKNEVLSEKCVSDPCDDDDSLLPVLNENEAVKEQILHSVTESKLLNSDGSQISLMDMVDKVEIFNPGIAGSDGGDVYPVIDSTLEANTLDKHEERVSDYGETNGQPEKSDLKSTKRESSRKRKQDLSSSMAGQPAAKQDMSSSTAGQPATKQENKRSKKPVSKSQSLTESPKQVCNNEMMFGMACTNIPGTSSSDIYDFVDEEDSSMALTFLTQPPTPAAAKSPTKKNSSRKGKTGKVPVPSVPALTDGKSNSSFNNTNSSITTRSDTISNSNNTTRSDTGSNSNITTRSETKNNNNSKNSTNRQASHQQPSAMPKANSSTTASASSVSVTSALSSLSSSDPPSSLLLPVMPKSPPSFSSLPSKSSSTPLPMATTPTSKPSSTNMSTGCNTFGVSKKDAQSEESTFGMSKKDGQSEESHTSLEDTFPMVFSDVDFHSSPKLSESHDDHENSIGLPAETLADFFNQHSPGKMILNSSPPNLQNGVLSPSDVDLPALRTPAPPINHSHSESVLTLDTQTGKEIKSPSPSAKQPLSRMHTPPPLDPKSPASSHTGGISISSSTPGPTLSLPPSSSVSSPLPTLTSSNGNKQSSCMNSSSTLHHLDPTTSSSARSESPMPSLSSSSLDALSEFIPLKPITSELESEEAESCSQQQRRQTPVQTQPLSHVPLGGDMGMGLQQSSHTDIQQKSQRQNPPHLPPQSSPHNLRPPSASTTPLPSPKLHASPGSASSVHSMSPAAQQQQQHNHSCQKQQQNSQMGSNPLMERVTVPPLSHPPQQAASLSQLFAPPDTSPRNANFASPPSGSNMKLKHMSPSNDQQTSNFINSQKGGNFSQGSNQ
ncbi:unnamed protein product, partial [Lymnaea stagnalis]